MNYELAKQLKDAGFPNFEEDWVDEVGHAVVHPTLSELIEACDSSFGSVYKTIAGFGATGWDKLVEGIYTYGSTPEEAVAKVWLELQK